MEAPLIKIALKSTSQPIYDGEHQFTIAVQDNKVVLATPDGRAIAHLSIQTMIKSVKDEDGDYHEKPSENFYLVFEPEDYHTGMDKVDKNIVGVVVNPPLDG